MEDIKWPEDIDIELANIRLSQALMRKEKKMHSSNTPHCAEHMAVIKEEDSVLCYRQLYRLALEQGLDPREIIHYKNGDMSEERK